LIIQLCTLKHKNYYGVFFRFVALGYQTIKRLGQTKDRQHNAPPNKKTGELLNAFIAFNTTYYQQKRERHV
jgi:hypothetical protein